MATSATSTAAVKAPRWFAAPRLLAAASVLLVAPALVSCGTPTGQVEGVTHLRGGIIQTTPEDAEVTATGGEVKLAGEVWTARSVDGAVIAAGEQVEVYRIDGATVVVYPRHQALP